MYGVTGIRDELEGVAELLQQKGRGSVLHSRSTELCSPHGSIYEAAQLARPTMLLQRFKGSLYNNPGGIQQKVTKQRL